MRSDRLGFVFLLINIFALSALDSFAKVDFAVHGLLFCEGHPCERSCDNTQPMTCDYEFTLEWYSTMSKACFNCPLNISDCDREDCIAADGVMRDITVVNRMLPGPTINVCLNDSIRVLVRNSLDNNEGTAIHWHGLYQKTSPWMDGIPLVTQCPIPSGTSFTYTFLASPAGTHWWHSHAGFQRSDGAAGPLIVRTPSALNPHARLYDVDWLHQPTMTKYLQHHHAGGSNKGEGMLINGRGRSQDLTAPRHQVPLTEFVLTPGSSRRFRIISNAAVFCPIEITLEGHVMIVIATDGTDVKPLNVTSLIVNGGERYDVIITANQAPGEFFLKAQGLADCRNSSQQAIIRYLIEGGLPGSSSHGPRKLLQLNPLNKVETSRVKYVTSMTSVSADNRVNRTPDDVIFIGFDFKKVDNPKYHRPRLYPLKYMSLNNHLYSPQLNNVTWASPHSPLLTQPENTDPGELCNTHSKPRMSNQTEFRACTHVVQLPLQRLVELVLYDEGFTFNAGHPMHLHGQHFAVVAMDKVNNSISRHQMEHLYHSGSIKYASDISSSVRKDTVIVPDGGYTIVRFYTDNPGVWLFHCHLAFHIEAGMTMAFRVGNQSDIHDIPRSFPKCGDWSPRDSSSSSLRNSSSC